MNIFDIANGHIKEVLNLNQLLSKERLEICHKCPIYSQRLGGVCNSNLWMDVKTGDVSSEPKDGYVNGCGCRIQAKSRLPKATCPANKW